MSVDCRFLSEADMHYFNSVLMITFDFVGEDGPSQMALEDLSMFRSIPGSTVFYPSDAVSTERAVELAANTPGVTFIRTSRPNTAILYDNNEPFAVGKAKVILSLKHQIKINSPTGGHFSEFKVFMKAAVSNSLIQSI